MDRIVGWLLCAALAALGALWNVWSPGVPGRWWLVAVLWVLCVVALGGAVLERGAMVLAEADAEDLDDEEGLWE